MSTHSKIPSGLGERRDQTYQEDEHDTYKLPGEAQGAHCLSNMRRSLSQRAVDLGRETGRCA